MTAASAAGDGPGVGVDPAPGRFLVLEGVEGAGKTTQAARLAERLRDEGIDTVLAREPGGTGVGEAIRGVLLHRDGFPVPAETELFLMLAARAASVREVVLPALARGAWVVADRFEFSTFAYQGYGRGLDLEAVRRINTFATGGLSPDLVLVLDLPVEEGLARLAANGRGPDRIEREGAAFLGRVREGYLELAAADPSALVLSAGGTPDEIHGELLRAVRGRFPEPFPGPTG